MSTPRRSSTIAGLLLAACTAPAVGLGTAPPPTPAPTATLATSGEPVAAADAASPLAEAAADASPPPDAQSEAGQETDAAADTPAPRPELRIEHPYVVWARKRPKGEVDAAANDELLGRWNLGGTSDPSFAANRPSFHPGTRVVVNTRVVSGRLAKKAPFDRRTGKHRVVLSETSLLVRSRKYGYWPFRICFEDAAREKGQVKGGKTLLRLDVDSRGRIRSPRVVSTKLEEQAVVECLRDRVKEVELLPPPRRIGVELSVQLWPGDVRIPLLPPKPDPPPPELDVEVLERVLSPRQAELEACYAEGLGRDAGLWGRLQLHVTLDVRGRVSKAQQSESQFPDSEVVSCIAKVVRDLVFSDRKSPIRELELGFRMGQMP